MDQREPYRAQHGPVEVGRTLAMLDRNRGTERMRVSLEEFNGYPFVRCQVWWRNDQGEWWPAKGRCVTFKPHEVEGLIEALGRIEPAERTHAPRHDRRIPATKSRNTSTWGGRPRAQHSLPAPHPGQRPMPTPDADPPFEPTRPFSELGDE